MSETEELSARLAKLEAWVEVFMRTLAGMQVEPVLIELDEARRAYGEEDDNREQGIRDHSGTRNPHPELDIIGGQHPAAHSGAGRRRWARLP
jgi:hypothetical protein